MMASTVSVLFLSILQISGFQGLFGRRRFSESVENDFMSWELGNAGFNQKNFCPYLKPRYCKREKYRSLDGQCNNLMHPFWGSSNTPLMRFVPPAYDDGNSASRSRGVNGRRLNSPSFIREVLFTGNTRSSLTRNINEFKVYFGQFVSHDISKTAGFLFSENSGNFSCCDKFDKTNTFCTPIFNSRTNMNTPLCYNFLRSIPTKSFDCSNGPRQQMNQQTSFLDLSNIYGTSKYGINYLRLKKKGLIKMVKCGDDILLPPDWQGITGCPDAKYPCMLAGDLRLNQHPVLTYIHVVWTLEHNRVAEKLYHLNPQWTDEHLFQEASKIVRAEYQHIIYNELLPIILGDAVMKQYGLYSQVAGYYFGYDRNINAGIRNGFSTAAYRYAHSMVDDWVTFSGGCPYASKKCTTDDISTPQEQLFRPSLRHGCSRTVYKNLSEVSTSDLYQHLTGGTELMRGILSKRAQLSNDLHFSEDLSFRMFDNNLELFSFDIQRGRDHGLPGYNVWREFCNLPRANSFRSMPGGLVDHTSEIARKLSRVYSSPDDIDFILGGLSETVVPGQGIVGPLFKCIIAKQFQILKKGDRYWYENPGREGFSLAQLDEIRRSSHARILLDNTHLHKVPRQSFLIFDMFMNPMVNTETIPNIDLSVWDQ